MLADLSVIVARDFELYASALRQSRPDCEVPTLVMVSNIVLQHFAALWMEPHFVHIPHCLQGRLKLGDGATFLAARIGFGHLAEAGRGCFGIFISGPNLAGGAIRRSFAIVLVAGRRLKTKYMCGA